MCSRVRQYGYKRDQKIRTICAAIARCIKVVESLFLLEVGQEIKALAYLITCAENKTQLVKTLDLPILAEFVANCIVQRDALLIRNGRRSTS